jgi:hypothetical protein
VSQTEFEMGTSRTICKKFSFLSREVMGMVLFVTRAVKNESIDLIFYKHKAVRQMSLVTSVQSERLDFYSVHI